MNESLYSKDRYPQGHPDLVYSLYLLGDLLRGQGLNAEAQVYHERALAICESLYPKDRYPQGHPSLATSLNELGLTLKEQRSYSEARWVLRTCPGDARVTVP